MPAPGRPVTDGNLAGSARQRLGELACLEVLQVFQPLAYADEVHRQRLRTPRRTQRTPHAAVAAASRVEMTKGA